MDHTYLFLVFLSFAAVHCFFCFGIAPVPLCLSFSLAVSLCHLGYKPTPLSVCPLQWFSTHIVSPSVQSFSGSWDPRFRCFVHPLLDHLALYWPPDCVPVNLLPCVRPINRTLTVELEIVLYLAVGSCHAVLVSYTIHKSVDWGSHSHIVITVMALAETWKKANAIPTVLSP